MVWRDVIFPLLSPLWLSAPICNYYRHCAVFDLN